MNTTGIVIVSVLGFALAVAVGWVVFHVGRIVFHIIRDTRAARRPARQLPHPQFGTLTFESNLWTGQTQRDGRPVHFCIAGAESGPNTTLVERLRVAIGRLPELERAALEFIRTQAPEARQGDFNFESLDFLWEQKPDDFAMEFTLAGDEDGLWRVEFESGSPKSVGRDD